MKTFIQTVLFCSLLMGAGLSWAITPTDDAQFGFCEEAIHNVDAGGSDNYAKCNQDTWKIIKWEDIQALVQAEAISEAQIYHDANPTIFTLADYGITAEEVGLTYAAGFLFVVLPWSIAYAVGVARRAIRLM